MNFKNQTAYYQGKVRNVHTILDKWLVMVASNRISAFDVVLPRPIPYKGQVLNQTAAYFLQHTKDIIPNWVIDTPLPHVTIGLMCKPFPIEMVIRGHLTGHAWRVYQSGARELCGVTLPEGMRENEAFPTPIITPSTKAHEGHDEDISRHDIIQRGLISESDYTQLEHYTRLLFQRGQEMAAKQGLLLVDTKYEFGKIDNTIYLIDEIHTPDSSRYFYADGFAEKLEKGEAQKQLSKEFVREWLIAHNFMGKEGQQIPTMTDEFVQHVSQRYIELYEQVTGLPFEKKDCTEKEIEEIINQKIEQLSH